MLCIILRYINFLFYSIKYAAQLYPVIYLGGLQPFFTVTKGVEKILVTMF